MPKIVYQLCSCGADCQIRTLDEEKIKGACWGLVMPYEEVGYGNYEYGFLHTCEGHWEMLSNDGPYTKAPLVT